MKLIRKVKASPDQNIYAYWFEVNQEEAKELKKGEELLFFTPHFKGNKTFDESFNFRSGNILKYLGDEIIFIQMIREDDIKKYGVKEYDIQPLHIKKIWDTFDKDECYYKECERIKKEFEKVLYTCKYNSDGVIFDIKPIEL